MSLLLVSLLLVSLLQLPTLNIRQTTAEIRAGQHVRKIFLLHVREIFSLHVRKIFLLEQGNNRHAHVQFRI